MLALWTNTENWSSVWCNFSHNWISFFRFWCRGVSFGAELWPFFYHNWSFFHSLVKVLDHSVWGLTYDPNMYTDEDRLLHRVPCIQMTNYTLGQWSPENCPDQGSSHCSSLSHPYEKLGRKLINCSLIGVKNQSSKGRVIIQIQFRTFLRNWAEH